MKLDQPLIAFVGLGNMGWRMAHNLAASGAQIIPFDADEKQNQRFREEHDKQTLPESELANADAMILMLPNGDVVREVLLGKSGQDGLAHRMSKGAVVVDMSSSDPKAYTDLATKLAGLGLAIIDAPVSGNVSGAEAGSLTIMAGGDVDSVSRIEPILLRMGQRVFRTGALGTGQAMKALNNLVSAGTLMLTIEALLTGKAFGLDPLLMNQILNVSTGRSNSSERKIEPFVLSGAYNSGFALALMAKDLRTAKNVAGANSLEPMLSKMCVQMANRASSELPSSADHTEIAKWLESYSGIQL